MMNLLLKISHEDDSSDTLQKFEQHVLERSIAKNIYKISNEYQYDLKGREDKAI